MKQKEKLAYRMRTSVKYLDSAYLKIFPMLKEELKFKEDKADIPIDDREEETEVEKLPAYSRQLIRNKRYYDSLKKRFFKNKKNVKIADQLMINQE